jgi:hypothetical protein
VRSIPINRRRFERFSVSPMYTPINARRMDSDTFSLAGHAYDISEGGIQFELDNSIEPGTPIAMEIELPDRGQDEDVGPGRSVFVLGNVIWLDDSEPGPVRMAMVFTRWARVGDKERLMRAISTRRFSRAA